MNYRDGKHSTSSSVPIITAVVYGIRYMNMAYRTISLCMFELSFKTGSSDPAQRIPTVLRILNIHPQTHSQRGILSQFHSSFSWPVQM